MPRKFLRWISFLSLDHLWDKCGRFLSLATMERWNSWRNHIFVSFFLVSVSSDDNVGYRGCCLWFCTLESVWWRRQLPSTVAGCWFTVFTCRVSWGCSINRCTKLSRTAWCKWHELGFGSLDVESDSFLVRFGPYQYYINEPHTKKSYLSVSNFISLLLFLILYVSVCESDIFTSVCLR